MVFSLHFRNDMKIIKGRIQRYGSLKDVTFQAQPFVVFIGPNGQGKSLILESFHRFFTDFNPVGGGASAGVSDIIWYRRDTSMPIEFEFVLELNEEEVRQFIPLGDKLLNSIKDRFQENAPRLTIKRSLNYPGTWKTEEIKLAEIPIVTKDVVATSEKILDAISPIEQLKDYRMYFFTSGYSKDNVGGDRILVNLKEKKGFTSHAVFDDLVKKGIIESSTEFAGKNWQEWAKENSYTIASPSPTDLAELFIFTPELLQKVITALTDLRGKFKLLSAARDIKSTPGQRASLLEPSLLQTVTSTSIDRQRQAEKRWERYRGYVEPLLNKRLEPNPTQVLLKEGDLGLPPSQVGGGEQSMMGVIWETMDRNEIFAIEEPENHLHPKLQREMLDYFLQLANETQVLLCTHSAIFASRLDIAAVYLVSKDEEGTTQVTQVNEANIGRVIDELGIKASDLFDYDRVAFVEGADDVKIFKAFARQFAKNANVIVGYIDSEGWNSMAYYANARILKSHRLKMEVFAIFDGDTEKEERNKKIKERLISDLELKQDRIVTLQRSSIEAYLLVPSAIKRAFPQIGLSEEEIADFIKRDEEKKNKKAVLDLLLKRGGIGTYNGEIGAQIAHAMKDNEIDEELQKVFQTLHALLSHLAETPKDQ